MAVKTIESTRGKGVVRTGASGRVTAFEEKKKSDRNGTALINSGVYIVQRELIPAIPDGATGDFGEDVFPAAVEQGLPVYCYRTEAPVIDVATPEGLARARAIVGCGS